MQFELAIGSIDTTMMEIVFFNDPVNLRRLFSAVLVALSIVSLKVFTK